MVDGRQQIDIYSRPLIWPTRAEHMSQIRWLRDRETAASTSETGKLPNTQGSVRPAPKTKGDRFFYLALQVPLVQRVNTIEKLPAVFAG